MSGSSQQRREEQPREEQGGDSKGLKAKIWPTLKNLLALVFLGLVVWLLVQHAQKIDWQAVKSSLQDYSWQRILIACLAAAGSYTAYACYDLFGRYYVGHRLRRHVTMTVAFICCAFTLNLGALIGSIGFRYRLYIQHGLSKGAVTHIVGMTLTTNWMGYIFLAGLIFASGSVAVPDTWAISDLALRGLGGIFLVVVACYFGLCAFSRRRTWEIRDQVIHLPSVRVALLQLFVSACHWSLMCAVIFTFLHNQIDYFSLLGVLLVSSIAGLLTHVPGALGVLEAVFLALLSDRVEPALLVAALIAYRAVFYLLPLTVAVVLYLFTEVAARRRRANESHS